MFKKITITLLILWTVIPMYYALAETGETPANPLTMNLLPDLQQAATGAQYGSATENTIPQIVGLIVRAVLSFVGAIFFILIIFSGIQWMTAGGNEEKITKARARMTNAAIGLAITTAAYFITWFISEALLSNV